jgi:hypothetical protein
MTAAEVRLEHSPAACASDTSGGFGVSIYRARRRALLRDGAQHRRRSTTTSSAFVFWGARCCSA